MSHSILPIGTNPPVTRTTEPALRQREVENNNNFATVLKNALENVSKAEHESNVKTELFAAGKIDNLHDVMITAQKASIAVETAVQIQQKVIDAYNEMMRMQV